MKRFFCIALALCFVISVFACGKTEEPKPTATEAPVATATQKPAVEQTAEPTPAPSYQTYVWEQGGLTIGVPWSLSPEPEKDGDRIVYSDPEGQWSVSFRPLSSSQAPVQVGNSRSLVEGFRTFGYYQDVEIGETTIGGYKAYTYSFNRNPDWIAAEMGYTTSYTEAHKFYVIDYVDDVIAGWGGLMINVSAPEKSLDPIGPILADEDVKTLLENITFAEASKGQMVSIPGISVTYPTRWRGGSDGDQTIWASIVGSSKGSMYFGPSIYADPKTAAGYVKENYRTLTFNGREWYGEVRTSTLSETTLKSLELFTDFTEYHALYMRLNITDWTSDADFWAFAETEPFIGTMESIVLDPASFHNREDDYKDASGFEANNVHEISGYTGTETDIVIPAVIGQFEMTGINTNTFKDNTSITSVVISEGIQYVGYAAFRGCTNLKSVVLPNSLTYIDHHAFRDCPALESVTFGDGLLTIGNEAFEDCPSLGDIILPDSLTVIGNNAFRNSGSGTGRFAAEADGVVYGSNALAEAKFTEVVIGTNANLSETNILSGITATTLTIGEGCTEIGKYFAWDPYDADTIMTAINLPDSLKKVGTNAFSGRHGVTAIDLGSIEEADDSAFANMGLRELTVPGTLKHISNSCFAGNTYLMKITVEEGVESADEWAFERAGKHYSGGWRYKWFTPDEAAQYPEYVPNGSEPFDYFVDIYWPSTLQTTGYGAFCNIFGVIYFTWVTEPSMFPANLDQGTFASSHFGQFFFTKETIDAYGAQLDALVSQYDAIGEIAWYDDGTKVYWTAN